VRKSALTGASSGLGLGFARALAAVGAALVLIARRGGRLDALAGELAATGATVAVQVADVSDPGQCQSVAARSVDRFGRIDVLVNNAGVGTAVPSSRGTPAGFRSVLDVNLHGTFWMAQACAPYMPRLRNRQRGKRPRAYRPRFPQAAYAASKAGVLGLTRGLAQEWSGRKGIRVNALCPGYFASEMTAGGDAQLREMVSQQSMLGRFGEQHELDTALLFLASPASAHVTGTSLLVDGGMAAL
jgi:NAD(P)-dependent dehydrogenase (short-subunit alcohol dehydrogenase family)